MTKKRRHLRPPLRDILRSAWDMLFGIVFAAMSVYAATKTKLPSWNDRIGAAVFLIVGLAIFVASARKMLHLFRPPSRTVRKRDEHLGKLIGLTLAFCLAIAMVSTSAMCFLFAFIPLLLNGVFKSRLLLTLPIASLGMALLYILSDTIKDRPRRRKTSSSGQVRPLIPRSGHNRSLAFCFLAAFPLGVGLLILGSIAEEGVPKNSVLALLVGICFLAFGLFLMRLAIPYARRNNGRPFARFHVSPGEVVPGRAVPIQCEIAPSVARGATRLVARPFVAILVMEENTPPPLERDPEGRRPDDAAAWYGEPFLDLIDPGAMSHASFELTLPDFREFSRKEGFNPWGDDVEWRLEVLLFRGEACHRRTVYRIRVAEQEKNSANAEALRG